MSIEYKGMKVDKELLKDLALALTYPKGVREMMVGRAIHEWIERQKDNAS